MSFPNPDYIKNFISKKLQKQDPDTSELLEDDALARSSLQEVTVYKNTRADEHGMIDERISGSGNSKETLNVKTPLQSNSSGRNGYGTSDVIDVNHEKGLSSFRKSKTEIANGENGKGESSSHAYQQKFDEDYVVEEESADEHNNLESHLQIGEHVHDHGVCSSDESETESEHCHDESDEKEIEENRKRNKALKKLIIATALSFLFMCGEIVGGYLANSLAVMTDASHLLTDVSSFLVSIIALQMAAKPSSKRMTFGWHRAEVIGAIASVLAIWVVTGILVYLAAMRLIKNEYEVDGKTMLITAACAVGFNIIMGLVLHESGHMHGHSHGHDHGGHEHKHESGEHSHKHEDAKSKNKKSIDNEESGNVNVRAAFIHVLGDLLQSLGVLIAAFIIYFKPEYKIADPICTFLFSVLVLATTITILRDTIVIIMEGTPAGISYEKVKERLLSIEGVVAVHDLRIWSLTLNQCVLSCHLAIDKTVVSGTILKKATKKMKSFYDFHSITIQVETYSMDMDDCKKCRTVSSKS